MWSKIDEMNFLWIIIQISFIHLHFYLCVIGTDNCVFALCIWFALKIQCVFEWWGSY